MGWYILRRCLRICLRLPTHDGIWCGSQHSTIRPPISCGGLRTYSNPPSRKQSIRGLCHCGLIRRSFAKIVPRSQGARASCVFYRVLRQTSLKPWHLFCHGGYGCRSSRGVFPFARHIFTTVIKKELEWSAVASESDTSRNFLQNLWVRSRMGSVNKV